MKKKDLIMAIIEAGVWYVFIYYFLYVIKNPVDLKTAAFVLLFLVYAGVMVCPWVRHTTAWRKMMGKE